MPEKADSQRVSLSFESFLFRSFYHIRINRLKSKKFLRTTIFRNNLKKFSGCNYKLEEFKAIINNCKCNWKINTLCNFLIHLKYNEENNMDIFRKMVIEGISRKHIQFFDSIYRESNLGDIVMWSDH